MEYTVICLIFAFLLVLMLAMQIQISALTTKIQKTIKNF